MSIEIEPPVEAQIAIPARASHASRLGSDGAYDEPNWYAVYTCANLEKRIAMQFNERSIENFLPLYQTIRRWKDRRMKIDVPLFPGYIFVRHSLRNRLALLKVPGVVRLVGFNGVAAPLPAEDIEALRNGLRRTAHAEPHPYLTVGRRVQIVRGPLEGLEGILVRRKGRSRVIISLDVIMRSIAVETELADVARISR